MCLLWCLCLLLSLSATSLDSSHSCEREAVCQSSLPTIASQTVRSNKLNIIHTKLRHCCILYHDLHKLNVVSHKCSFGAVEDTYYIFFNCKNYINARNKLLLQRLNKTNFASSIPIFYYGATNHYLFYFISLFVLYRTNIHTRIW